MPYRYNIPQLRGDGIHMGTPMNRFNCAHLPELLRYAAADLHKALRLGKKEDIDEAQRVYDERLGKYNAYREAFPDLLQ